jgi:F0F1-type ATP synthase membrane subunit b/b'
MVLVTGNWRAWLIGTAASLVIFAVVFFTVIKPSSDTANQAIKTGLQQSQQAINQGQQALNQAQKQLTTASGQSATVSSQAGNVSSQAGKVSSQAQQELGKAAKLTSCLSTAGTDVAKVQACQVKFGH